MVQLILISYFKIWLSLHPFHVSVCEVNYDVKTNALQITQKVFVDDLEQALFINPADKFDIDNKANKTKFDAILKKYFEENIYVTVNNQSIKVNYLGHEFDDASLWCYLEVGQVTSLHSVKLTNRILFEKFSDQSNIVHIEKDGNVKSFRLTENDDTATVSYDS